VHHDEFSRKLAEQLPWMREPVKRVQPHSETGTLSDLHAMFRSRAIAVERGRRALNLAARLASARERARRIVASWQLIPLGQLLAA